MADPWVTIIGLGEDGLSGLSDASRSALKQAEIIFGGPRHLDLVNAADKGQPWPVPFATAPVLAARGKKVVVLASGDPFWHGAGGSLMRDLEPGDWQSLPAPSCFSLAANLLGWKLEDTYCLGLHAAPFARLRPVLHKGAQVLCTLRDGNAPEALAKWLVAEGETDARFHVLERLGGPKANVHSTTAAQFSPLDGGAPVLAAIEATSPGLPRASGLEDGYFASDGQITKRPIRALTLSALAPRPGERLWDIGGGSGSVSVEWCLAAPGATALTIEARPDRLKNINENAVRFGIEHRLTAVHGRAPEALAGLPRPDCVFIGGGCRPELLSYLKTHLPAGTRLVANGVTLETETLLMQAQAELGGHLLKAELAEVSPLGRMRGWDRSRPVLQWSVTL